ncbi:FAD:protein FMN transferase, partial [Salmonella enterica]|uniref:FAD:protein FMN transferase n=1 Tax=Salmonella enterica TaxID=28901 RepID=UPI0032993EC2
VGSAVGPVVNLWGFGPDREPLDVPTAAEIDAAKAKTGLQHLQVIDRAGDQFLEKDPPDLYVDLPTVGQGYPAQHLGRLMVQE